MASLQQISPRRDGVSPAPVTSWLRRYSFLLLLLLLLVLHGVGLGYFARGFFLTRFEVAAHSQCPVPDAQSRTDTVARLVRESERADRSAAEEEAGSESSTAGAGAVDDDSSASDGSCWFPRQYDGVIILLIDALRFDFLLTNTTAVTAAAAAAGSDATASPPPWAPYENGLPIAESLLRSPSTASHSALYRFEADPPTVTMQRLKGLTTGALPTFIDIKDNFASSGVEEDNWLWQLAHQGKQQQQQQWQRRQMEEEEDNIDSDASSSSDASEPGRVLFFGDDTWFDLYPPSAHFAPLSKAYPSFDVQDLHTVDRGCRRGLDDALDVEQQRLEQELAVINGAPAPAAAAAAADASSPSSPAAHTHSGKKRRRRSWDVLLAHFLGVDHVGHRFGPSHPAMRDKLAETNKAIQQQVDLLKKQREHNQRIDRERKRRRDTLSPEQVAVLPPLPEPQHLLLLVMGDHGMTSGGNHGGQSEEEIYAGLLIHSTKHIAQQQQAVTTKDGKPVQTQTRGDEGRMLEELRASISSSSSSAAAGSSPSSSSSTSNPASSPTPSLPPLSPLATSWLTLPQIDLVPTLSLLLGKPIPFGNLGKVALELFWGRQKEEEHEDEQAEQHVSEADHPALLMRRRVASFLPLLLALHVNAQQLFQYLSAYAALRGSDVATFFATGVADPQQELPALFEAAERLWTSVQHEHALTAASVRAIPLSDLPRLRSLESLCFSTARAHYLFLLRAAAVAKEKWTVFHMGDMALGIGLILGLIVTRITYATNAAVHQHMIRTTPLGLSARFAPAVALTKLIVVVFTGLLLPLHALCLGLRWSGGAEDVQAATWMQQQELAIAAAGTLVAALVSLVANLLRRRRAMAKLRLEETGVVDAGFLSGGVVSVARNTLWFLRNRLATTAFPQLLALSVMLLYAQGLFSNSFIIAEAPVALVSAAVIAGGWLFGGDKDGRRASWGDVLRVAGIVLSLRCMQYASYGTSPDAGFADEKYSHSDVALMAISLLLLPFVGVLAAVSLLRRIPLSQPGRPEDVFTRRVARPLRVVQLVSLLLFPLACALIFLFWAMATPASPAAAAAPSTSSTTSATAAPPLDALLADTVTAAYRHILSPLELSDTTLALVARLWLPRTVYAMCIAGIALLVALPASATSAAAGSLPSLQQQKKQDAAAEPSHASSKEATAAGDGVARRRKDASNGAFAAVPAASATAAASVATASLAEHRSSDVSAAAASLFALQCVCLLQLVSLPIMLVWGPKSCVVLLCLSLIGCCIATLGDSSSSKRAAFNDGSSTVSVGGGASLSEVCFFFLLSCHLFWSSGHGVSFSSLQISAAFVGLEGFNFYASGALLMLNTFGGIVLAFTAAIATVAARNAMNRRTTEQERQGTADAAAAAAVSSAAGSSASPVAEPFAASRAAVVTAAGFASMLHTLSLLFVLRSFLSVLNVTLQRRHLMVWAIFAPKFIFDAVSAVIAEVTAIAVAAACARWSMQ